MKLIKLYLAILAISLIDPSMEAGIVATLNSVKGSIPRITQTLRRMDPHIMESYVDGANGVFDKINRGVKWVSRLREIVKQRSKSMSIRTSIIA